MVLFQYYFAKVRFFEQLVILSLNAYNELRKQNDNFDFGIIDQMVGGIKANEK